MLRITSVEPNFTRRILQGALLLAVGVFCKVSLALVYYALSLSDLEPTIYLPVAQSTIILVNCIIQPVYEEIMYRLPLKFNIAFIRLSFLLICADVVFLYEINRFFTHLGPGLPARIMLYFLFASVGVFLLYQRTLIERLQDFWQRRFAVVLVVSQTVFAVTHLNKFDFNVEYGIIFAILAVIIYLIVGLYFSIVRMKLGILMSIIFHILFNSTSLLDFI
jgi:membrane protease YdiL (CAAX protease family)